MDSIRVSEAPDPGSIPGEATLSVASGIPSKEKAKETSAELILNVILVKAIYYNIFQKVIVL